ncbi:MAG TPA: hypothetical protein VFV07_01430 [Rhizomicrobium sp.]|nr:hypothetical protein [Rhizomicrobium sp.]
MVLEPSLFPQTTMSVADGSPAKAFFLTTAFAAESWVSLLWDFLKVDQEVDEPPPRIQANRVL